ncbi:MAG TPA: DUF6754 domain-containing protein [Fimbriimonadaceae bacterium]|nr:DUF6754 domain-containing protein [Fimbriimonadaceae bacterium]
MFWEYKSLAEYQQQRPSQVAVASVVNQVPSSATKNGTWFFWKMTDSDKTGAELVVPDDKQQFHIQTGVAKGGDMDDAAKTAGLAEGSYEVVPSGAFVGGQYMDTGWFGIVFTYSIIFFVLFNIFRARKGKDLFIRRIAGLNAIDEAIGRSTEMGRPVLMVPGIGSLDAISVQALNIFAYVAKTAARFATPIRVCCADAAVYTVAQEIIRDTYQQEGLIDRYDLDSVRFISDRQFAFAAGVSGTILREQTAATFFMGNFYAESLIFAETANSVGAIQVASSTQITQTPFFIAACDYVLIGNEFYAASAYLTREPVLVGSLVGQDWSQILIIATIIAGFITASFEMGNPASGVTMLSQEKVDGGMHPILGEDGKPTTRAMTQDDTFFAHLIVSQSDPAYRGEVARLPNPIPVEVDRINSEAAKKAGGGGDK